MGISIPQTVSDMVDIDVYESIWQAEKAIREIKGNGFASQSYNVLRAVERSSWRGAVFVACRHPWRLFKRLFDRDKPFRIYVIRDEKGNVLCVAPLYHDADGTWSVVGSTCMLDYVDFLYARMDEGSLKRAFDALMVRLRQDGVGSLRWGYLDLSSLTNKFVLNYSWKALSESENVRICLDEGGLNVFFQGLGKHVRQNIRTAYNRLVRDGRAATLSVGGTRQELDRCRAIYLRRQSEKYQCTNWRRRFCLKHATYVSLSIPGENGWWCVCRIDGRIAAYMEGYVNEARKALEIPRLSMNADFAWYSPGMLLLCETIKWLYAHSDIRVVDLCRGREKYKYDMGGEKYLTRNIQVDLRCPSLFLRKD